MREGLPPPTCHVSHVKCNVSRVTRHVIRPIAPRGAKSIVIFTNSALRAGSVIESPCPFVCVSSITKIVIVNNGQRVEFFVFLPKRECVKMVLRILNLKGHQHLHNW